MLLNLPGENVQHEEGGRRSKRRHQNDHDEAPHALVHDESNWLVSYADLMTLLFGFFVLMYSFSRVDKEKFEVVSKDVVKYFGGKMAEPGAPEGVRKLKEDLNNSLQTQLNPEDSVVVQGDLLVFTLGSDLLFAPGSARPTEKAIAVVNGILQASKGKTLELIEVEGHTDSDPISTTTFPSNWELSTARASSIVRIFETVGMDRKHLKAAGFADTHPMVTPDPAPVPADEAKRKNRRVVINLRISPDKIDLKQKLKDQGIDLRRPEARPLTPDQGVTSGSDELVGLQDKYEQVQARMKETQARLKEAQDRQKKMKEFEKLAKKTEEMERKIQEMEQKAVEISPAAGQPPVQDDKRTPSSR